MGLSNRPAQLFWSLVGIALVISSFSGSISQLPYWVLVIACGLVFVIGCFGVVARSIFISTFMAQGHLVVGSAGLFCLLAALLGGQISTTWGILLLLVTLNYLLGFFLDKFLKQRFGFNIV